MKGIAILSVVLYHLIPHFSAELTELTLLSSIFEQFQIPLFLFVSGYFFYFTISKGYSFKEIMSNKVKRLLIPYLIFGTLLFLTKATYLIINGYYDFSILDYLQSMYTMHAVKIVHARGLGFGPTWFLLMLFIITLINYFLYKREYVGEVAYLVCILSSAIFVKNISLQPDYTISSFLYFTIPFQSGFIMNKYKLFENQFFNNKTTIKLSFVFFLVLIIIYKYLESIGIVNNKTIGVALLYIFSLYLLFKIFEEQRLFQYLGKNSMVIYLLHGPYFIFIGLFVTKNINATYDFTRLLSISICLMVCIVGPLCIMYIYSKLLNNQQFVRYSERVGLKSRS
jgi:fucose 4-O-acetylase-like acetyltransferase